MNWRLFAASVSGVLLIGVNVYFLSEEQVLLLEEEKKHEVSSQDPLRDLVYIKANRKANFEKLGLSGKELELAMRRTQDIEDLNGARAASLLKSADDPDALADALCGEVTDISPRYGALRFLVTEDKGRREAVDLKKISVYEEQEWALRAPITGVFSEVELIDDRQPDASLMALAAILLAKEQMAIEHDAPWGRGIGITTWSWDRVKKENPGIDKLVIDYFATQHLLTEYAQAEGGICDG